MTFLTAFSPAFASRAKVCTDSIKKYHPGSTIVRIVTSAVPLGTYVSGLAKARLEHALEMLEMSISPVVIIGADCEIMSPMTELEDHISKFDVVVVPHVVSPVPNRNYMAQLYRTGHANADLIAFRNTDNARSILRWLISVTEGDTLSVNGAFYEQTWLSAIPFLFEGVHVMRDRGYNIGYWYGPNMDVSNIRMFQYSGYEKGSPQRMSRYYGGPDVTTGDVLKLFQSYDERITE